MTLATQDYEISHTLHPTYHRARATLPRECCTSALYLVELCVQAIDGEPPLAPHYPAGEVGSLG